MGLVHDVRKKDDDMRVVHDVRNGQFYLETSVELTPLLEEVSDAPPGHPTQDLFEAAAAAPNVDVHVLVVRRIFAAHCCFLLAAIFLSLPWWGVSRQQWHIVVMCVASCAGFPLAYGLMMWFAAARHITATVTALVTWWCSCTVMLACTAILAADTAPFQLAMAVWAQCIAMLVYTSVSTVQLRALHAAVYMAFATVVVWGASIALSFSTHDWGATIGVLCAALACVPYHTWQVRRAEGRYHAGWDDTVCAVVNFYGDPVTRTISAITS